MMPFFSLLGICSILVSSILTGCSSLPNHLTNRPVNLVAADRPLTVEPLQNAYNYRLIDSQTQQPLTVKQLAIQLQDQDIVFVGELHGNHASHLLEMRLMTEMHILHPQQILSMEMFNRDQQPILNRYLDSEIGEAFLINEAPTWSNYTGSYRPLIEFAKQNFIPVIAANAPADIVRCIGRQGSAYLNKLLPRERHLIASKPLTDQPEYRLRYMDFLADARKLTAEHKENSYLAQLTRDNTMAESIYQAWLDNPHAQILHLNGQFHSEYSLGTVSALKSLNSKLKVAVISAVLVENAVQPSYSVEDLKKGDVIYLLQNQPEQYLDSRYKQQARKKLFSQAEKALCR